MTAGLSATQTSQTPPRALADLRVLVILLLAAVIPYANTLFNGFVYDDVHQILENPYVQSPRHLREILTTTVWSFRGEEGVSNYYRPLMMLSFLGSYMLFGAVAGGFHMVNVVLHACVVRLLYLVTLRLFSDRRIAFVAAILFAVHPIHSETVAWVAALPDLQLTALVLGTFLLLLREPRPLETGRNASGAWPRVAVLLLFVLALLAKEPAMMLPALVVVFEHCAREGREQTPWREKAKRYAGLWVLLGAYLVLRVTVSKGFAPVLYRGNLSWPEAILSGITLVGRYVAKLFWPAQLSAFYPFEKSTSLLDTGVLAGLGVLLISLLLFVWLWKRARTAAFALLWMYATLAPVLNARWMPASVFAERYLYLPSVGFCWLVAWAGVGVWDRAGERRRGWRIALAGVLGVVALAGGLRIGVRNLDWRNDYVLYARTLEVHPDAHLMRLNLGYVYWRRGDLAAAEREWKKVLQHVPTNVVILNNLGQLQIRQGEYQEAITLLDRAIKLRPDYAMARINLGRAYEGLGEAGKALEAYARAVQLSPLNPLARNHLGGFYERVGRLEEAEAQYRKSLEARATAEAAHNLGEMLFKQEKREEAEDALKRAVELNPYDEQALFMLASIYLDSGRKAEAVHAFQAVLETDPANPRARAELERLGITTRGR